MKKNRLILVALVLMTLLLAAGPSRAVTDACEDCLINAEITTEQFYQFCKRNEVMPDGGCEESATNMYRSTIQRCYDTGVCRAN